MSAAESWDQLAARPAVIRPAPPVDPPVQAQELATPTVEQVRATEAVFAKKEHGDAEALIGLWTAGMLANELIRDAAGHLRKEDDDDEDGRLKSRGLPPAPQ